MLIRFSVPGDPKGQPRLRAFAFHGKARVYDPGTAEGWKSQIALAATAHMPAEPLCEPLRLSCTFWFERPKCHYRTGKNAHLLRETAPKLHMSTPDMDNVIKALKDALTTLRMWRDDSLVCEYGQMRKLWGPSGLTEIVIESAGAAS